MKKISILDLPEDLLVDEPSNKIKQIEKSKRQVIVNKNDSLARSVTVETLVSDVAKALAISIEELNDWAQDVALPESAAKAILATAKRLKLNPLLGQIAWEINLNCEYEVYIPIDGWITLIHREPSFQGLTFNQATETENKIPIWMECSIFRSGLAQPITIREYYAELKTEHPMWQQMPCRMLRHKTLQQCARLAFGITAPELNPQRRSFNSAEQIICSKAPLQRTSKQLLKDVLRPESIAR